MFQQLEPPIPLPMLGKGDGYALAVIDHGQEHDLIWVTAIEATGEIRCAPNPEANGTAASILRVNGSHDRPSQMSRTRKFIHLQEDSTWKA